MNCTICNQPINRFGGYYLVGNSPHCSSCFKETNKHRGKHRSTRPFSGEWENDNLLEAFRAYQERERKSAFRRY